MSLKRFLVRRWAEQAAVDIINEQTADLKAQASTLKGYSDAYTRLAKALADLQLEMASERRSAAQLLSATKDSYLRRIAELEMLLARKEEQLTELDGMHAEVSARLEQAEEELAGYRTAEAIADETRAKRYYDGQGDQ